MKHPNLPFTWRPALDGLRGIAVISVLLFHFKTDPLFPGGWLGVDIFFVISGYLISLHILRNSRFGSVARLRFQPSHTSD